MPQHRFAFGRQEVFQHLAGARVRDMKHGKGRGRKDPRPEQVALVFMAGFIDVELLLVGQHLDQRLIDGRQCLADFIDDFGQHPRRKGHP